MRLRTTGVATLCVAVAMTAIITWPASAGTSPMANSPGAGAHSGSGHSAGLPAAGLHSGSGPSKKALKLARRALPANDGWAAAGSGTSGGSAADGAHVFVARDRAELVAALGGDNATNGANATSKIVFVRGTLHANVDDANQPLSCADYADPDYSLDAFLATYDPAVWGTEDPEGPLEDARVRSTRNQRARIVINVGPNTTILGLGHAVLRGFNLNLRNVSNVIIRNVDFQDAADCFPEWSPGDGDAGNWNSLYDTVTLSGATNVWVDHNSFSDGDNLDSGQPIHLGRPYQVHDGSLDIIRGSNLVTVSYNHFHDHDKTMLIGSTNTVGVDLDKLKVTIHHNSFADNGQRLPRVRFGQVDVYNNLFVATDDETFQYAWGVGVFSSIYAENNFVILGGGVPLDAVVFDWRGSAPGAITAIGSFVLGRHRLGPVNFLAEFNATHDPDIPADAGWTPTLRRGLVAPAVWVPFLVLAAGSGKLPT